MAVATDPGYTLVKLASGVHSIHSLQYRETFHPVIGPVAEAQALYIRQIQLQERLRRHDGEFVIWDVGLGAAANVLTVLRETREIGCSIRLLSFDHTVEPLQFALLHGESLGYLTGYEDKLKQFIREGRISFSDLEQTVNWELHVADFPTLLKQSTAQ